MYNLRVDPLRINADKRRKLMFSMFLLIALAFIRCMEKLVLFIRSKSIRNYVQKPVLILLSNLQILIYQNLIWIIRIWHTDIAASCCLRRIFKNSFSIHSGVWVLTYLVFKIFPKKYFFDCVILYNSGCSRLCEFRVFLLIP